MTPPPPSPFPGIHRHRIAAGETITRVHSDQFEANAFNPGLGGPTRFAPLVSASGAIIPHLYAAQDYEAAAHETIFHDVPHDAAHKSVAKTKFDTAMLAVLRCRRDLVLASLFQPDLHAWGIERSDLIDSYASTYGMTAKWALAIHDAHDVDGLIWTSRRCDPQTAMLLFGDRVKAGDLDIVQSERITHADHFGDLRAFGVRANITITL